MPLVIAADEWLLFVCSSAMLMRLKLSNARSNDDFSLSLAGILRIDTTTQTPVGRQNIYEIPYSRSNNLHGHESAVAER